MNLEVIMSVVNLKKESPMPPGILDLKTAKIKCLIINQIKEKYLFEIEKQNMRLMSFAEKGISKSRNSGLNNVSSEFTLITDEDIRFKNGFDKVILSSFANNPKADIIVFQMETNEGKPLKIYKKNSAWLNVMGIMKVSSVEIAFRTEVIKNQNLKFDENFGLGSKYPTGEEAIFLADALRKRLKILYVPIPIVIHPSTGSGYQFKNNVELIRSKGALFYRIFNWKSYFVCFLFALKKYKLSSVSFFEFLREMYKGISSYKQLQNG
jgi:glycosyltransferase involved in cell wall biosynthesis